MLQTFVNILLSWIAWGILFLLILWCIMKILFAYSKNFKKFFIPEYVFFVDGPSTDFVDYCCARTLKFGHIDQNGISNFKYVHNISVMYAEVTFVFLKKIEQNSRGVIHDRRIDGQLVVVPDVMSEEQLRDFVTKNFIQYTSHILILYISSKRSTLKEIDPSIMGLLEKMCGYNTHRIQIIRNVEDVVYGGAVDLLNLHKC